LAAAAIVALYIHRCVGMTIRSISTLSAVLMWTLFLMLSLRGLAPVPCGAATKRHCHG
jgi:hypothetical protein